MEKINYFDIPKNFTAIRNDILIYDEDRAIIENVKNIIDISKHTRLMDSNFGSTVKNYLFAPMLHPIAFALCKALREEIMVYEDRVNDVLVSADFGEEDNININVKLYAKGKVLETAVRYYY